MALLAFAQRRAQSIRAQGDKEAAQYYTAFKQDESFAIFLRRIRTLEEVLPHNTTFILDANQLSLQDLFNEGVPMDQGQASGTQGSP